jgi:hypothetical protein
VPQFQQLVRTGAFHHRFQLLLGQLAEEAVVDLGPPLRSAVESASMGGYNLDWYSSSSEFSGDSTSDLGGGLFCVGRVILNGAVRCVPSSGS